MNNLGYGYPSSNLSSFSSSFSSQYASTPTTNTRFQRPRFAYAGPPSYPRPRSSASKPNPEPYGGSFQNSDYKNDFMDKEVTDYSHGYMDSMRNNFGDSTVPPLNDSLTLNKSRDSFNNSNSFVTCNESFQSPEIPSFLPYENQNSSIGSPNRRGFNNNRRANSYFKGDSARATSYDSNFSGQMSLSNPNFEAVGGSFSSNVRGNVGTFSPYTRGQSGATRANRGNARGRSQNKKPIFKGGRQYQKLLNPMAPVSTWKCQVCSIDFTSQIPLDMHLRGAKHAKKLKSQSLFNSIQGQIHVQAVTVKEVEQADGKKFYCELCSVIANSSVQLQMHLDGTKHKTKLQQSQEEPKEADKSKKGVNVEAKVVLNGKSGGGVVRPAPAEFGEQQPAKMMKYACDTCGITVNSDIQLQQHLSSKKHQAKLEGKPIIKKKKGTKQEGDSEQSMDTSNQPVGQSSNTEDSETQKSVETENQNKVVGVKTLNASFVKGSTLN